MRVHWLILRRPVSPSWEISSNLGMALVRSWITIEAVIYGERPTKIIENEVSPPPEIRLRKLPKSDLSIRFLTASLKVVGSPRGTGICAKILYANKIPKMMNDYLH